MAKYSFEVIFKNSDIKLVTPEELVNGNISDFDQFVEKIGGAIKLEDYISKKLNIPCFDIRSIKILGNKNQTHFALMSNNKYLTPIFSDLSVKTINSNSKYSRTTTVISNENTAYQEMKQYLLDNIRKDYNYFLTQVYTLNNEFSKLLYRYGYAYNQKMASEGDIININELEKQISQELSIYKNYRGLCRYRTLSETKTRKYPTKNIVNNLDVKPSIKTPVLYTFDKEAEIAKQTEFYNREYEEFLEPNEYEQMLGRNYN